MSTIILLGMHRSGTSLVSSMIHKMGVPMGISFLEPDEFNPHGYWEDIETKEINKLLLEACGGNWDTFVTRKQILVAMPPFLNKMKSLADKRAGGDGTASWGFKDPRTCITVWAWSRVIPNAKYVIVHRKKRDVMKSLIRTGRDGSWNRLYRHYWGHIKAFESLNPSNHFYHIAYEDLMDSTFRVCATMGLMQFIGTAGKASQALDLIKSKDEKYGIRII